MLIPLLRGTKKKRPAKPRNSNRKPTNQISASTSECPECGSNLVIRTAKKGPNAGSNFLVCSMFPRCRHTEDIS
ncbi:MAG: topoisomerase DNA-binding C4 zinc finger domain-containing protein [Verrucomicrobiales bacterium]